MKNLKTLESWPDVKIARFEKIIWNIFLQKNLELIFWREEIATNPTDQSQLNLFNLQKITTAGWS